MKKMLNAVFILLILSLGLSFATAEEPRTFESRCVYFVEDAVTIDEPCSIEIKQSKKGRQMELWSRNGGLNRIFVTHFLDGTVFFGAEIAEEFDGTELTGIEGAQCYRISINNSPRVFCRAGPVAL